MIIPQSAIEELQAQLWQVDCQIFEGPMGPGLSTDWRAIVHPHALRVKVEVLLDEAVFVGVWTKFSLVIDPPSGQIYKSRCEFDRTPSLEDVEAFLDSLTD